MAQPCGLAQSSRQKYFPKTGTVPLLRKYFLKRGTVPYDFLTTVWRGLAFVAHMSLMCSRLPHLLREGDCPRFWEIFPGKGDCPRCWSSSLALFWQQKTR